MKSPEEMEWFLRWMDRNGLAKATAFVSPANLSKIANYDDRLLPFLFGNPFLLNDRDQLASRIKQAIEKYDFLKGLGEFALYWLTKKDGRTPYPPDSSEMLEVYDIAAEHDLPVMVHAAGPDRFPEETRKRWDSPLDCPTIEQMANAYEHNRDATFLVHQTYFNTGEMTTGEMAANALDNHPNLYYDISPIAPYAYAVDLQAGEQLSKEEFEKKMAETGVEHHATKYYEEYKPLLEGYSDRVLWGMDSGLQWHYNEWVLDPWMDIGRALLGRLPAEKARNIGYRTAEELFDIGVDEAQYSVKRS